MLDICQVPQFQTVWKFYSGHWCLSVAKARWGRSILWLTMACSEWCCDHARGKHNSSGTYGYIAIVVSLTKISLLGTSAVLQVKAWGGGILCFLQNSAGEILYSCLTSCKSDLAATTKHGILLSMKCCCKFKEKRKVKETVYVTFNLEQGCTAVVAAALRSIHGPEVRHF